LISVVLLKEFSVVFIQMRQADKACARVFS